MHLYFFYLGQDGKNANETTKMSTVVCSFYTHSFIYELWVLLLTISVKTRKDVLARPANVNVDLFLSIW